MNHDDLRAKALAATPGPWETMVLRIGGHSIVYEPDDGLFLAEIGRGHGAEASKPNAEYIAAASPDVLLALLDEIAAKDKEIAALHDEIGELEDEVDAECQAATRYSRADPQPGTVREALLAAQGLAKLAEDLSECRGDDGYIWDVQHKISAALTAFPPATDTTAREKEAY